MDYEGVRLELQKLAAANHGHPLTATQVVAAARSIQSRLHHYFEWNTEVLVRQAHLATAEELLHRHGPEAEEGCIG